jgi:hypothetical protein
MPVTLNEKYVNVWTQFTSGIQEFVHDIERSIESGEGNTHDIIGKCFWIPYTHLHNVIKTVPVHQSSGNIGAATGIFFELILLAVVRAFFNKHLSDAIVTANCWPTTFERKESLPRDPDISVSYGSRRIVFEAKASPKKRDIEKVLRIRECYLKENVEYFCVSGALSLNYEATKNILSQPWFTAMDAGGKSNELTWYNLDQVLEQAKNCLKE